MIKITIEITAESGEQAQQELSAFAVAKSISSTAWVHKGEPEEQIENLETPEEKTVGPSKPRAKKAVAEKLSDVDKPSTPYVGIDDLKTVTQAHDPLAATTVTVPSNDPLAVVNHTPADPLAAKPEPAKQSPVNGNAPMGMSFVLPDELPLGDPKACIELIRHKVSLKGPAVRSQVFAILAGYKKVDEVTDCFSPSDLQEKDYEAVYQALDKI